jgi:hypothetical protein
MSIGNGGAAIGLANSNKIVPIGSPPLVADLIEPAGGVVYAGVNVKTYWSSNWLGEDPAGPFTVPSENAGKVLAWVTSGGAPIVVPVGGGMAVAGGVATVGAGFKSYVTEGATIPAGSFFWVESA